MKTKTSFRNILILLGIIASIFLVAYYFIYQDIKTKNEHISSLVSELNLQSTQQEYVISTQRMIQDVSSDMDRVNGSIVASDGDVSFIERLEALAKNAGLDITIDSLAINDDPMLDKNGITQLEVKAKIAGSWSGMYTFLAELESLPFKIKVNGFSMLNSSVSSATQGQATSGSWQGTFDINVLKYK